MNWTDSENTLGPRTWTFGFNRYGQIWIKRKLNPGPETGLKARKFGFKAGTKYGVYSCPSLPFLRIENRAKIKRHVFCSKIWIFREKTLKE